MKVPEYKAELARIRSEARREARRAGLKVSTDAEVKILESEGGENIVGLLVSYECQHFISVERLEVLLIKREREEASDE